MVVCGQRTAKIGRVQIDSIVVVNACLYSMWFSVLMSHRFAVMRADGFERGLDKLCQFG